MIPEETWCVKERTVRRNLEKIKDYGKFSSFPVFSEK